GWIGHSNHEIHDVHRRRIIEHWFRRYNSSHHLPQRFGWGHSSSSIDGSSIRNVKPGFPSDPIVLPIYVSEQPTIFVDGSPSSVAGGDHGAELGFVTT
ncbi:hypothetical protein PanWU01x14_011260, partial [Parasponia andersonii]